MILSATDSSAVPAEALANVTRDLPPVRISEIVLGTRRYDEMRAWWQAVLGVDPYLDNDKFSFRRLHTDYPYTQVLAIFHVPDAQDPVRPACGLHHMQFRHATLSALFDRFERLRAVGIRPTRSMNHGPSTSFYYTDPDGNTAELSGPNFDTEQEYLAYFDSEAYRKNISGIAVDPDEFVARFRGGEPQAELVKIP